MKAVLFLLLILFPFVYTFIVKQVTDVASKYVRFHPTDAKITNSTVNLVCIATVFISSFISSAGIKMFQREIFQSNGNDWLWVLFVIATNIVIIVGKMNVYREEQPGS